MRWRANASVRPSPPCAAMTNSECRTSRRCSRKHGNKQSTRMRRARSCAAPATPCCDMPPALLAPVTCSLLFRPTQSRRNKSYEYCDRQNMMAEMKLLGMFGAFDETVAAATRDQTSYTEFLDTL